MKKVLLTLLLSFPAIAQDGTITFTGAIVSDSTPHTATVSTVQPPTGVPLLDYYATQEHGLQVVTIIYQ